MSPAAIAEHYALVRAKFFPPVRPIVTGRIPLEDPAAAERKTLAPPPTEADIARIALRSWMEEQREAHRLTVLVVYDAGIQRGRERDLAGDDGEPADIVIRDICNEHGITAATLRSPARNHYLVDIRRQVAVELRRLLGLSDTQIARKIDRDRTTVLNLLGKLRRRGKRAISVD